MKDKIRLLREALKLVYRSSRGWTMAGTAVSVLRSVLPLLLIWLLKLLIDAITAAAATPGSLDTQRLLFLIIAVALVYFADEASSDAGSFIRKKQSVRLETYMYDLLHEKSVKLDLINFNRPEYYNCLSRASKEATWRPNSILNNLISFFRGGISLLLMAGLISTLNWKLVLLLVAANVPGIWFRFYYSEVLYNLNRQHTAEARKAAYFSWLLTGDRPSREIRLFGLGKYFSGLFMQSFLKQKDEEIAVLRKRSLVELLSAFFKASVLLVTLLYIARSAVRSEITIGEMAMFLLAFRQGMLFLREVLVSAGGLYEDSLFIADLFEFLNLKEDIVAVDPVAPVVPLKKKISARDLTFKYPGNSKNTIENVSFEIKKGEIIALVGPNGAGKTTLVRLLCRLYNPDSGSLEYDGTDIRHTDPEEYRRMFSVIFQDFMLYNLTAGENIRLGDINKEDDGNKIRSSAAAAGADAMISSLPAGYQTPIGNLFDDSRELSWGEWQKIALSRSLYRDASVLVLDEPSSALDAETEHEIFSRFREIVKGRTTILISHRFTNVSLADRILVLDKGRIVEEGTHLQLMRKGGLYSSMYKKQSERFSK